MTGAYGSRAPAVQTAATGLPLHRLAAELLRAPYPAHMTPHGPPTSSAELV